MNKRRKAMRVKCLSYWEVPEFVCGSYVAVIYASATRPTTRQVLDCFEKNYRAGVAWANIPTTISFADFDWLHTQQRKLGWPESNVVREGYYLFLKGEVQAYESGQPDSSKDAAWMLLDTFAKSDSAGASARGRTITFFSEVINRKTAHLPWEDFLQLWGWAPLSELTLDPAKPQANSSQKSETRRQRTSSRSSHAPPPPKTEEQLREDVYQKACLLLKVSPSADEREVKRGYRALVRVHHPDLVIHDPELHKLATRRMQELNGAYQFIERHRGWC